MYWLHPLVYLYITAKFTCMCVETLAGNLLKLIKLDILIGQTNVLFVQCGVFCQRSDEILLVVCSLCTGGRTHVC